MESLEVMQIKELIDATEQCMALCREMLEFETEKRRLLLSGDYDKLDGLMTSQQSAIMRLDNLETARVEAQRAAGLEGLTAKEIIERLDDAEEKQAVRALFTEWQILLDQLQNQNAAAMDVARQDLLLFQQLAQRELGEPAGVIYGREGVPNEAPSQTTFEEKI